MKQEKDWAIYNWPLTQGQSSRDNLSSPERFSTSTLKVPSVRVIDGIYEIKDFEVPDLNYFSNKPVSLEKLERKMAFARRICFENNLPEPEVEFDRNNGIARRVNIGKNGNIELIENLNGGKSIYKSDGISDIKAAFVLQLIVGGALKGVIEDSAKPQAYVDSFNTGYGSRHLSISRNILDKDLEDEEYSEKQPNSFFVHASQIANEFGHYVSLLKYKQGVLQMVKVKQLAGNTMYYIPRNDFIGSSERLDYLGYSVDTITQAFSLHGVIAEFINTLQ